MKNKQIFFTDVHKAELIENEKNLPIDDEVFVRMEYTVVSGGTERAFLMGMENTARRFPISFGYCGVGKVEEIGPCVKNIKVGDRVLVYHGQHSLYNCRPEAEVTKVDFTEEQVSSLEAAFVVIASMGLGGVRKLELEFGESAMVMGQGFLGVFATQFLRQSGALPLIVADLNPARRELALKLGADYALDPSNLDFVEKVKEITGGKGVRATVEVTGVTAAVNQALKCASFMGRISLLGCTRADSTVNYYTQVHQPGIKLIGAHNFIRPKVESYPHHWTHQDDCKTILQMIAAKRIQVLPIVSRIENPEKAPQIYNELCDDPNFPMGTVFDWRNVK